MYRLLCFIYVFLVIYIGKESLCGMVTLMFELFVKLPMFSNFAAFFYVLTTSVEVFTILSFLANILILYGKIFLKNITILLEVMW